jgi:peptide deformylase
MSVLPIYTYGAPVLRKKAVPVKKVTDEVIKLIMDMYETMHKAQGIGLAATQVGNLHKILVLDVSEVEEMEEVKPMTLINPEVLSREGQWMMEEGCLSIPNVRDDVERAETITVRYQDTNLNNVEAEFSGLLARVVLHEIDHLNGVLFIDHLSDERKKNHKEALQQIQRGEMEVSYPVVTAVDVSV